MDTGNESKPIRIAFLDTSAVVAYFIQKETGYKNMRDLIDKQMSYNVIFRISVLSISEIINVLQRKRCIPNKKSRDKIIYYFMSWLIEKKYMVLHLPNQPKKFSSFVRDVRNNIPNWARKSPVDAFLVATMETHLNIFVGPSEPFLVSTDKGFCKGIGNKGYLAYNPSEESFKDFMNNKLLS